MAQKRQRTFNRCLFRFLIFAGEVFAFYHKGFFNTPDRRFFNRKVQGRFQQERGPGNEPKRPPFRGGKGSQVNIHAVGEQGGKNQLRQIVIRLKERFSVYRHQKIELDLQSVPFENCSR